MPAISVIIPVYNDPEGIAQTLRSVVRQTHPSYEVVPVDNNSNDETPAVISKWRTQHSNLIHPTEERDVQSSYAARNTGIEHARGDILVFIDADMTVPEDWLSDIASEFANTETDYLGYEVQVYIPEGEEGLWGWYDQIMGLPSRYHYEQKQFVPTSCLAVRKTVFEKVGKFDERLISSGDREFGNRVHDDPDLTMSFSNDIVVYHPARTSFNEHYAKALRIGRGLFQVQNTSKRAQDAHSILSDLVDHLLPPSPLRIYRQSKGVNLYQYMLLYLMDLLIRYIRLYGALTSYFAQSEDFSQRP